MKKITITLLALSLSVSRYNANAQLVPVKPTHIVIVVDENHSYSDVIGSSNAPTFTALSTAANTANFTNDFESYSSALGEPNALEYFSGFDQGVTSDLNGPAPGAPFNDCNLGSSLIQHGYTFIGYAEGQPSIGWIAYDTNLYETHHIPWINWVGYNTNADTIPLNCVVPYSHIAPYTSGPTFPDSNHYSDSLPTVSIIVPDIDDDMHDGSVAEGDTWFNTNIMPYVRWCNNPANNSIMIVTWADGSSASVPLLVSGAMVQGGTYTDSLTHYNLLRTIEDMYGLSECANSDSTITTSDWPNAIWKNTSGINSLAGIATTIKTWPVPAKNELNIEVTSINQDKAIVTLYDVTGRNVKELTTTLNSGQNYLAVNTNDISSGAYFLTIKGNTINICDKIELVK